MSTRIGVPRPREAHVYKERPTWSGNFLWPEMHDGACMLHERMEREAEARSWGTCVQSLRVWTMVGQWFLVGVTPPLCRHSGLCGWCFWWSKWQEGMCNWYLFSGQEPRRLGILKCEGHSPTTKNCSLPRRIHVHKAFVYHDLSQEPNYSFSYRTPNLLWWWWWWFCLF